MGSQMSSQARKKKTHQKSEKKEGRAMSSETGNNQSYSGRHSSATVKQAAQSKSGLEDQPLLHRDQDGQ